MDPRAMRRVEYVVDCSFRVTESEVRACHP